MDHLTETVKVKHPELGFTIINKDDFDAERHELFEEPKADAAKSSEKGSEPDTENEPVEIPEAFADLKWMQQVALAKKIDPNFDGKGPEAVALIEAEVERRKTA